MAKKKTTSKKSKKAGVSAKTLNPQTRFPRSPTNAEIDRRKKGLNSTGVLARPENRAIAEKIKQRQSALRKRREQAFQNSIKTPVLPSGGAPAPPPTKKAPQSKAKPSASQKPVSAPTVATSEPTTSPSVGRSKQPVSPSTTIIRGRLAKGSAERRRANIVQQEIRLARLFDRKRRGKSPQERAGLDKKERVSLAALRNRVSQEDRNRASAADRITSNRIKAIRAGHDPSSRIDPAALREKAAAARRLGDISSQADALRASQRTTPQQAAAAFRASTDTIGGLTVAQTQALRQFASPITGESLGIQQNQQRADLAQRVLTDPASQAGGPSPTDATALRQLQSGDLSQFAPGQLADGNIAQTIQTLGQAPAPAVDRLKILEAEAARLRSQATLTGGQFQSPEARDQALTAAEANPAQPSIAGLGASQLVTQRQGAEERARQLAISQQERALAESRAATAAAVTAGGGVQRNQSIDAQQKAIQQTADQQAVNFITAAPDFGLPASEEGVSALNNQIKEGVDVAFADATSITAGVVSTFTDIATGSRDRLLAFAKNATRKPMTPARFAVLKRFVKDFQATGKTLADIPSAVGLTSEIGAGKTHTAIKLILDTFNAVNAQSSQ